MANHKLSAWKHLMIAFALITPAAYSQTISPQFFGLTTLSAGTADSPLITTAGMVRSLDVTSYTKLDAYELNPSAGVFNLGAPGSAGTLEHWVTSALAQNQEIVFLLGGSPQWASSNPTSTPSYNPGYSAPPADIATWNAWVTAVVTQFKGRIKYYELWNEVNNPNSYSGTQAQLLALAQSAYSIIHSIDPSALLMTPTCTEQSGASYLDSYLSQTGASATADVIAFHSYNGNSDYASAEEQYSLIQDYKTIAANHGMSSLPLISTEGDWGAGTSYITDPTEQANYLAKYMVEHAMQGISSAIWYAADAGPDYGQLYTSGALNAAGLAYQQVQTWLIGSTIYSQGIDNHGTYHLSVTRPDGTDGVVVWNSTSNQTISFPISTNAQALDGTNTPVTGGTVIATTSPQFVTGP